MTSLKQTASPFDLNPRFHDPLRKTLFGVVKTPLERLLKLHALKHKYSNLQAQYNAGYFLKLVLDELNVTFDIPPEDIEKIPSSGPVVVVANHPYGAIEGVILASMLSSVRSDVRLLANYLLGRIPELREHIIPVDPFGAKDAVSRNISPLKQALSWLTEGGMLGVFPAGEVAHLDFKSRAISDPKWNASIARIIRMTKASVVPVYFDGTNGLLFQLMGLLHPQFRTVMLPRELLNKKHKSIPVRVGNVISVGKINSIQSDDDLIEYLRLRTFIQGQRGQKAQPKRVAIVPNPKLAVSQKPVIDPVPETSLALEIEALPAGDTLVQNEDYLICRAESWQIPHVLREIGRLREITFREVGEGTGKEIDLDRFDQYYTHLFIWHKQKKELVGAYRIGMTDKIIKSQGIKGLYTRTLFKYRKQLLEQINPALELGRSFIRREYQREFSPLHLLWKGIGQIIARNPEYKMLFGPVSISDGYKSVSRQLLVSFLKANNYDSDLAKLIKPKSRRKGNRKKQWIESNTRLVSDLKEVSSLIAEIETDKQGIPVLLRHYIKLGGRLLGFNIDPKFSDALDGLILVDLARTDKKILERYLGKEDTATFLDFHALKMAG